MKKRGMVINLSNRLLYFIIISLMITGIILGISALTPGVKPNPGHLINEFVPRTGCYYLNQEIGWNGEEFVCIPPSQKSQVIYDCEGSKGEQKTRFIKTGDPIPENCISQGYLVN